MDLSRVPEPGQCYMNAINIMVDNMHFDNLVVVHGLVTGNPNSAIAGHRIVHAWLEDENYCYDLDGTTMMNTGIKKELYYLMGNIKIVDTHRYSRKRVHEQIEEHGHAGPWDNDLLEHAIDEEGSIYEKITEH